MIGDNPDLGTLNGKRGKDCAAPQECVDHHIFQDPNGMWHLWGCIRGTAIGRILYHWKSDSLTKSHWEQTGEILRSDQNLGEDIMRWDQEEWIQSPYFVKDNGKYFMFYGGHSTEWDYVGYAKDTERKNFRSAASRGQICLMTSDDGIHWKRELNPEGQSRLFMGPGETRDPMVMKIGSLWYLYHAGAVIDANGTIIPQVYARTSEDLYHWSDFRVVHYDPARTRSEHEQVMVWTHECPHVVYHCGYYYLFRTENYAKQLTHVYRSEDPLNFGLGDQADAYYVGTIEVGAPEIICDEDGSQYITSNHDLQGGTMMCRLKWVDDE